MAGKRTTRLMQTLAQGRDGICIHLPDGRIVVVVNLDSSPQEARCGVYAPADVKVTRVSHHCGDKDADPDDTLAALQDWNLEGHSPERDWAESWDELFGDEA